MIKTLIVTRSKNRNEFLPRCINSILKQSISDWHHVIINDGGDADKIEKTIAPYLKSYNDRLTLIHNPKSMGMEAASNKGINHIYSKYIAIHDDDDSWHPDFLAEMVERIELFEIDGIVCHVTQVFENKKESGIEYVSERYYNPDLFFCSVNILKIRNQFLPISFVFSRKAYVALGGFDENFQVCGDWDFHYRFIRNYRVTVLRKRLAFYHTRSNKVINGDDDYLNSIHDKKLHDAYTRVFQTKFGLVGKKNYLAKFYDFHLKSLRFFLRQINK